MRNPAEGKSAVPMRDPKNAVPLRTARGNANADAKEVLDNFMNAPANLKRKSETKAATAAVAQAAAKQRRIEHAQPLPRVVEVKSKIDHQNKLATSSRRPAGPAASREAPSSSASARARASSSAAAAKDVTPLSSAGKVGQSFGQEPHSRASSSFAPSPCGSVRSTATSAETLREQLQQQMDDNAELTESLEKIRKTEFAALQKAEGLRLELEREKEGWSTYRLSLPGPLPACRRNNWSAVGSATETSTKSAPSRRDVLLSPIAITWLSTSFRQRATSLLRCFSAARSALKCANTPLRAASAVRHDASFIAVFLCSSRSFLRWMASACSFWR